MPEPDLIAFDFSRVVSTPDGGDVRRFPRTATLTDARYDHDSMVTRHTHTGKWPSLNVGPDGSAVEGNSNPGQIPSDGQGGEQIGQFIIDLGRVGDRPRDLGAE